MAIQKGQTFLISRTDAIGDVILTLPIAGWLKENIPGCQILFLGRTYTKPIIACCPHVDGFLNWDEIKGLSENDQVSFLRSQNIGTVIHVFPNRQIASLAKSAGIKNRIGTRNRWFHWLTCNKLVALSRKNSDLHESQLNLMLLQPLGLKEKPGLSETTRLLALNAVEPLSPEIKSWLKPGMPHIILHPKSQGSAREWGLANFGELAKQLHQNGVQVFISGTQADKEILGNWLNENKTFITDITGKLTLPQFISFIYACDGLIAASTGPLHIASGLGIHALGIYPPIRPMHPGRWAPIGPKAEFLVVEKDCSACKGDPAKCVCMMEVPVAAVLKRVEAWFKK